MVDRQFVAIGPRNLDDSLLVIVLHFITANYAFDSLTELDHGLDIKRLASQYVVLTITTPHTHVKAIAALHFQGGEQTSRHRPFADTGIGDARAETQGFSVFHTHRHHGHRATTHAN